MFDRELALTNWLLDPCAVYSSISWLLSTVHTKNDNYNHNNHHNNGVSIQTDEQNVL